MKPVIVMARPVDGGAPIIGSASDVCIDIWGHVPTDHPRRYPRRITSVLKAARAGIEFKGYKWEVLPAMPVVLPRPSFYLTECAC